ncbi:hypothetical protein [Streptomyces sudanensis]|uniref:hypothetical protein n=1 Tax=Streptomyces sudanensis TaxID=436397 RepID=UPI0020CF9FA1|nr:hypothetical protein [Streptomyces sudanensis]MCP9958609.1 hypothetical protein [Streptomyces sudanensis]MCQ0000889.1 hypothetical protein [Streptomyces sudanensis]
MSKPSNHVHAPIEPPPPDPAPVEGCPDCAELVALRARARARGDMSAASDCNVLLRRHPGGHR